MRKKSIRKEKPTNNYRSGLEVKFAKQLTDLGIFYEYEKDKVKYIVPESKHVYTPDFKILENGIYIETKGRFTISDRKKHLHIRKSNPELDIRFVFMNSKVKISKKYKTTYADWCNKNGFKYCDISDKITWALWCSE